MRRFDGVIFDMDGVLIDSEPLHFEVLNQVLSASDGYVLSRTENDEFLGTTAEAMFSTLIARHALRLTVADYVALYETALLRLLGQPREPAPGVRMLIERLGASGIRLAVASSSKRAWVEATLRSLGLTRAFQTLVSGDDVSRGKPDPAIYALAAERLGVDPRRCLAIEDAPNGVESARRAGMAVLGVRTSYTAHLALDGVLQIVDSLGDVDLLRLDLVV